MYVMLVRCDIFGEGFDSCFISNSMNTDFRWIKQAAHLAKWDISW